MKVELVKVRVKKSAYQSVLEDRNALTKGFPKPSYGRWGKVGVFKNVYATNEIPTKIIRNEIKPKWGKSTYGFEEFQYQHWTGLSPTKVNWGIPYRRNNQSKSVVWDGVDVRTSILTITEYVLKRLHQRSGFRVIRPSVIWKGVDQNWLGYLQRNAQDHLTDAHTRNLWIVPFEDGVFAVEPVTGSDFGFNTKIRPSLTQGADVLFESGKGFGLSARTFVTDRQLFDQQVKIKNLVLEERYEDALDCVLSG